MKDGALVMSIESSISDKNTLNESYPFPQPSPMPPFVTNDKLVQVFLKDYVFNTFGYSLFTSGKLSKIRIDPKMENFNVIAFSIFWPNLLDKYSWNQFIEFECGCLSHPYVFLKKGSIDINADIGCSLLVKMSDGSYDSPFKVELNMVIGTLLRVEKGIIKFQIEETKINSFTTIFSKIGELNLSRLQDVLNFGFKVGGPIANNYLKDKGVPLPVLFDIDFGDAIVLIEENMVEIDLTPVFHSSLLQKKILKKDKFDMIIKNTLKLLMTKKRQ